MWKKMSRIIIILMEDVHWTWQVTGEDLISADAFLDLTAALSLINNANPTADDISIVQRDAYAVFYISHFLIQLCHNFYKW